MRLLLVEDKDSFRRLLTQALEGSAWTVAAAADPQEALRLLEAEPFHLLVTDLRLPGFSGLELIRRALRLQPGLRTVLMSAYGEPRDIVEAMRLGADDFLPKPFGLEAFLDLLERVRARVQGPPPDPDEPWVAQSPALRALGAALGRAAGTDLPVLLRGERGTGRTRCARRLHTLRCPAGPYLDLEAAALGTEGPGLDRLTLLRGGTLHLKGLGHLTLEAARALAAAMDSDPGRAVGWVGSIEPGEALPPVVADRLGVLELQVPPLRERREDILPLARALIDQTCRRLGRTPPWLERAAERQLLAAPWPGNAADLADRVEQALAAQAGPALHAFPEAAGPEASLHLPWPAPGPLEAMLKAATREAERCLLARALAEHGGRPGEAAEALGLSLRTFTLRLRDHGLPLDDDTGAAPPLSHD